LTWESCGIFFVGSLLKKLRITLVRNERNGFLKIFELFAYDYVLRYSYYIKLIVVADILHIVKCHTFLQSKGT